jgi:hypothetical protein
VVDDLLRTNTVTRAEAYSKFCAMGVTTANQVRKLEGLPATEGGDVLANPLTTTTTTTTGPAK